MPAPVPPPTPLLTPPTDDVLAAAPAAALTAYVRALELGFERVAADYAQCDADLRRARAELARCRRDAWDGLAAATFVSN